MKVILELIRIILIFFFLGSIFGVILSNLYGALNVNTDGYEWMGFTAIFVLLFVLYRNKLQYSGWYAGKGKAKIPKRVSSILVSCSILLLVLLPIVSYIMN
ncbi:hypothetical protein [Bacillus sp. EAC]|uniref:hypothetical protein n=1 Tax=Bacillus sp. EAC TaxID=1978338 RepID=UPI000B451554|nr:hypothetical protein [Bacillus sp. EAC]